MMRRRRTQTDRSETISWLGSRCVHTHAHVSLLLASIGVYRCSPSEVPLGAVFSCKDVARIVGRADTPSQDCRKCSLTST